MRWQVQYVDLEGEMGKLHYYYKNRKKGRVSESLNRGIGELEKAWASSDFSKLNCKQAQ